MAAPTGSIVALRRPDGAIVSIDSIVEPHVAGEKDQKKAKEKATAYLRTLLSQGWSQVSLTIEEAKKALPIFCKRWGIT